MHSFFDRLTHTGVSPKHNQGFVQLFVSKQLIQGLATAMMALFVPIFLYVTAGEQFWVVALFYMLAGSIYVCFLPSAMKVTNQIGFHRALAVGALFLVVVYTMLYFMEAENFWLLFVPLAIAVAGFRLFHWVPYRVDFTEFSSKKNRARDVSLAFAAVAFMGVIGPVLAGYIIDNSGYDALFLVGIVLLTCASVSYLFVPQVVEVFTWKYGETWKNLCSKTYRPVVTGEFASGCESIVSLVAWPVFLYVVFEGNLLDVGLVSTAIVGVTIIVQLAAGKYLDVNKEERAHVFKYGTIAYALGWVAKIFVFTTFHVFIIGLYHNITRIFVRTPFMATLYDLSGDQGHNIDEFTALREMAHHSGRVVTLLFMIGLTAYFSVEWTFVIAAIATLMLNAIYRSTADA